eukprot:283847-Chlamydomonas_euryale.AAC.3
MKGESKGCAHPFIAPRQRGLRGRRGRGREGGKGAQGRRGEEKGGGHEGVGANARERGKGRAHGAGMNAASLEAAAQHYILPTCIPEDACRLGWKNAHPVHCLNTQLHLHIPTYLALFPPTGTLFYLYLFNVTSACFLGPPTASSLVPAHPAPPRPSRRHRARPRALRATARGRTTTRTDATRPTRPRPRPAQLRLGAARLQSPRRGRCCRRPCSSRALPPLALTQIPRRHRRRLLPPPLARRALPTRMRARPRRRPCRDVPPRALHSPSCRRADEAARPRAGMRRRPVPNQGMWRCGRVSGARSRSSTPSGWYVSLASKKTGGMVGSVDA